MSLEKHVAVDICANIKIVENEKEYNNFMKN